MNQSKKDTIWWKYW